MALEIKPLPGSTRFPFINLEKAIGRAKELYNADQRGREMPIGAAFAVWEYSEKSSGGFQTIAALKMYGLLKDSSSGDSRKIALSDAALRYFRDEREEEKKKLARDFALVPKLMQSLWLTWHASPPADTIARSHLKAERGLNDQGARSLLAIYKENLAFAELKASDKVAPVEAEQEEPDMEQAQAPASLPTDGNLAAYAAYKASKQSSSGVLQEVFNLDEGPVTLTFPASLSSDSYADLKDHLDLFLRKAKRQADKAAAQRIGRDPDEE
jgi:hypothetical protein